MNAQPGRLQTLRNARDLSRAGLVAPKDEAAIAQVTARYAVAITPAMTALIDADDPADPIARQFVPSAAELVTQPHELADPIGDDAHSPVDGIVHRYPDRVLLKIVQVCPVYCRFCFRRESVGPGKANALSAAALDAAISYIRARPEVWEVILTGGDPLSLSPRRIAAVTTALAAIDHVKIVRWHTRVPVVAPERVTDEMLAALACQGKTSYLAIHANHPREFTADARRAIARLCNHGFTLVSQSVLLKGVNDDVGTLSQLMRTFVENRIKPYYLHHGDLAPGTSHFRTTVAEGRALVRALRGQLSGLCQPTYVLDIPGGYGKSPLTADYVSDEGVMDYGGQRHAYPPCGG